MEIITSLKDLRAGDLMFGPIHKVVGLGVGLAQLALAVAEPGMVWELGPRTWFKIRHTGVVVSPASSAYDEAALYRNGQGPMLVQAMPGRAEMIELNRTDHWTKEYVYLRPDYDPGQPFMAGLEYRGGGFRVAHIAKTYVGTPYDFATYGAIPAYRRGIQTERIKTIISDTSTMMCSRLVDAALDEGGYHVFDDGRLPGNVTPSELYRAMLAKPLIARTTLGALKP